MNTLEQLRKKNPDLPLFAVTDPEFAPYGRILPCADRDAGSMFMPSSS